MTASITDTVDEKGHAFIDLLKKISYARRRSYLQEVQHLGPEFHVVPCKKKINTIGRKIAQVDLRAQRHVCRARQVPRKGCHTPFSSHLGRGARCSRVQKVALPPCLLCL
jgi:hypothetical protein